jgi:hypothetical protein
MIICTRMYDVSISSPELWAYIGFEWPKSSIERYISRAAAVNLTMQWVVYRDSLYDEDGSEVVRDDNCVINLEYQLGLAY